MICCDGRRVGGRAEGGQECWGGGLTKDRGYAGGETQERRWRRNWQRPALINMLFRHGERDQTCAQPGLGVMPDT